MESKRIKSVLSRVLSQEIAHQEQWMEKDLKNFGKDITDREGMIAEIKQWMEENGIEFNNEFYIQEF